jgi:amino acid transporter
MTHIFGFISNITPLQVFVVFCISAGLQWVSELAMEKSDDSKRKSTLRLNAELIFALIAFANAIVLVITLAVSIFWGVPHLFAWLRLPDGLLGTAVVLFILFGMANGFQRSRC